MATTITNTSKRKLVLHLDHPTFYKKRWGWSRITQRVQTHHPRTGKLSYKEVKTSVPGTLTLLAGESREGLPDHIAACTDVRNALRAGPPKVKLEREPDVEITIEEPQPEKRSKKRTPALAQGKGKGDGDSKDTAAKAE